MPKQTIILAKQPDHCLYMSSKTQMANETNKGDPGPNYTPYDGGESTSIPPALANQGTSSTTMTAPSPSIANRHVNRRLPMCANRKLRSSKLFDRSGPSYTPYHMMAESRPLYLLIRLIRSPLRLQRRYQAHPLLKYAAFVVYICVTIANYTVASSFADRDQPTHHTI